MNILLGLTTVEARTRDKGIENIYTWTTIPGHCPLQYGNEYPPIDFCVPKGGPEEDNEGHQVSDDPQNDEERQHPPVGDQMHHVHLRHLVHPDGEECTVGSKSPLTLSL